jgi:hypothetical protein
VNERLMAIKMAWGRKLLNVVSTYAPQMGKTTEEKDKFWWDLMELVASMGKGEEVIIGGDLNGHVGELADGYEEAHGGFGFGKRNEEGERILEFCEAMEMKVVNTWDRKEERKRVTFESGEIRSMIDYILVRRGGGIRTGGTETLYVGMQHRLVMGEVQIEGTEGDAKKRRRDRRIRIWRLKDEKVRKRYAKEVEDRWSQTEKIGGEGEQDINQKWERMKETLRKSAEITCGRTTGKPRKTMQWSEMVQSAWKEKWRREMVYNMTGTEKAKEEYKAALKTARKMAKREFYRKITEESKDLESDGGRDRVFKLARKLYKENQDVDGAQCLKVNGSIITSESEKLQVWRNYFEKLLNEENVWDGDTDCELNVQDGGEDHIIKEEEVARALKRLKEGKAAGQSGIVAELLKGAGEAGVKEMTELCNLIVSKGHIPEDWKQSILVPIFKGKGDPMECGSYRGIKLLEHAMKVVERVLESRLRGMVKVDEMQFGFSPGKGTTDAIYIIRQIQERHREKGKELFYAFIDLEKAYDRVPREVTRWAMRKLGVAEWMVSAVMALYEGARTVVRTEDGESESFEVKVGLHQGSVLSPLLFLIVMEAVTRNFRGGLPWELLYADDLVLIAESLEELLEKLRRWKLGLERKGLKVNVNKTKIMMEDKRENLVQATGRFPCAVCKKGVGGNSIRCRKCGKWVHGKCSKIKGKLALMEETFRCGRCCNDGEESITGGYGMDRVKQGDKGNLVCELGNGEQLEVVNNFCYLGDTIEAGGGVESAVRTRIQKAWHKFRELGSILTMKGLALKVKGRVYDACVRSTLLYGSETWAVKVEQVQRMERTEMQMVRWMCGTKLSDRIPNEELRGRLGIESVKDALKRRRLRWWGHIERREESNWLKRCQKLEVLGKRLTGRPKKSWREVVKRDLKDWGLKEEWALDRGQWRRMLRR